MLQDFRGDKKNRSTNGGRTTQPPPPVRVRPARWFSADLIVAAGITLGTLALLVWGGGRVMASLRAAAAPASESSALLIPTAPASPLPAAQSTAQAASPADQLPTATATLPPLNLPPGRVSVRLLVVQRAWVRAAADGLERYRGRVEPGAILDLSGDRLVEVSTGNAAAFRVSWNGQDLGPLGGLDEVVTRLWTPEGPITPTPTVTSTPTITAPPSATPAGTVGAPGGVG